MKKAVAIVLFLALVTCAFSGCVENEFTPTPAPTLPPRPASTPATAVGVPPERLEQIYLNKVMELDDRKMRIHARSQDTLNDYLDGKTRFDVVKILYRIHTEDMYEVVNEMASLNPPPRYREFHRHYLESMNLQYSSMLEFTLYLEDEDADHVGKAAVLIEEAERELELARAAMPT